MSSRKKIVLGITGGIAAYKSTILVRLLIKNNYDVQVVMTKSAKEFVTSLTFESLSGKPVFDDMWESTKGAFKHIQASRDADLILIAPATANILGKIANGISDDILSNICVARNCPLYVAPAMNREMWTKNSTQRNINRIIKDDVYVLGPDDGIQACGENGTGRMMEPEEIIKKISTNIKNKLSNKKILLTVGATFEPIDAVRGITNLSSGKMGIQIAKAAENYGANVTIVAANTTEKIPEYFKIIRAVTSNEMLKVVDGIIDEYDIFIAVAAVSDFKLKNPIKKKLKKEIDSLSLNFTKTSDILSKVTSRKNPPFSVGFAAESDNLQKYAKEKLKKKKVNLIAANLIKDAIGKDYNKLTLFDKNGEHVFAKSTKANQAAKLIEHISKLYYETKSK